MPRPGVGGCRRGALAGKTVVISGVFPEVGGGAGLSLGKERVKAMVESFGGRVTSAISGKTDCLLIGKEPGFAKVSQAQGQGCALLNLKDVSAGILKGNRTFEEVARIRMRTPVQIEDFSAGFRGNGLALKLGYKTGRVSGAMVSTPRAQASAVGGSAAMRPGYANKAPSPSPQTAPLAPKAASKYPPTSATGAPSREKGSKEEASSKAIEYTAAPLATIDLSRLKPSRFLFPPAALPFRDETAAGRISLDLLRDSAAKVAAGAIRPPDEVVRKLHKWLKHAEAEVAKKPADHAWTRRDDGSWVGPGGEVRAEVFVPDSDGDEEAEGSDDDEGSSPDEDGEEIEEMEGAPTSTALATKRKADSAEGGRATCEETSAVGAAAKKQRFDEEGVLA
jgi:hypothetical protein